MGSWIAVLVMAAAVAAGAAQASVSGEPPRASVSGVPPRASVSGVPPRASVSGVPPRARQQALLHLLKQDCGSCHGLTLKGGLGPALLPEALHDKSDTMLVDTILHGRPGTPMPPWAFSLTAEEALWLVQRLRTGDVNG